jgi:membrane associated rhomboid family serine protease
LSRETSEPSRAGRPVVTLGLLLGGALLAALPGLDVHLALDRAALGRGEVWRVLTGHLIHGGARLAVLDLVVLGLLAGWLEHASRTLLVRSLLASALLAGGGVFLLTEFDHYVGSSALSSGVLVACAAHVLRWRTERGPRRLALLVLGLFAVKLLLEALGVWPAALGGLPDGARVAGWAHALGAAGGACAALTLRARR